MDAAFGRSIAISGEKICEKTSCVEFKKLEGKGTGESANLEFLGDGIATKISVVLRKKILISNCISTYIHM